MSTLPSQEPDAAWATVELAVAPAVILRLLEKPELLLRLNPCMEFERLERLSDGRLSIAVFNESNGFRIATDVTTICRPESPQLVLRYSAGIKRETRFQVEASAGASRLTITEVYSAPAAGDAPPAEVDRSLLSWTAALRRHLVRNIRYGRIPGYTWLAESFWLSMPPRHRRIAWLITWTTAAEFAVFIAVLAVYLAANR